MDPKEHRKSLKGLSLIESWALGRRERWHHQGITQAYIKIKKVIKEALKASIAHSSGGLSN